MKRKLFFIIFLILFLFLSPKSVLGKLTYGDSCEKPGDPPCPPGWRCEDLGTAGNKECTMVVSTFSGSSLQNFQETITNARDTGEMPRERWMGDPQGSMLSDITDGLATDLIGEIDWDKLNQYMLSKNSTIKPEEIIVSGGVLSTSAKLIASVYVPPASSIEYFADLGSKLGIAKPAYAQGVGFSGLSKLLPLWKAFRNIAYLFFVIIFVVIGLAIMFRVKLDPKTVITIQNALPKMIIALVLITFSYAIAGFLIDLIYVTLSLAGTALTSASVPGFTTELRNKLINMDLGTAFTSLTKGMSEVLFNQLGGVMIAGMAVGVAAFIFNPVLGIGITAGSVGIPVIIIGVISLYLLFKLFLALVTAYIKVIMAVIFAPFQILLGVFPGSQGGFSSWISGLIENLLIFPAVALFIIIGGLLVDSAGPTWSPPVLGLTGGALTAILGLGVLILTASIPQIIHGVFTKKPFDYGSAIGQNLSPVTAPIKMAGAGVEKGVVAVGGTYVKAGLQEVFTGFKKLQTDGDGINIKDAPRG